MVTYSHDFESAHDDEPGWNWALWFRSYWERILLLTVIALMLGMVGQLFWPQPQATVILKPYVAHMQDKTHPEIMNEGANEQGTSIVSDLEANADDVSNKDQNLQVHSQSKRRASSAYHKKPAHPPITNLNTAKSQQLQLLPGIGPKMAERIVEYRKVNHGFQTIEQVMDVKGIGEKKFAKMKAFLKV
jgi:comEA protein